MARRDSWLDSEGAFTRFYADNAQELIVFFAKRVLDTQVALDLAAESFAQAFLSRSRFQGHGPAEARAWLYGIARHQLARFLRKGAAERRAIRKLGISVPELSQDEHRRVEEQAGTESMRRAIRDGLGEISADHRRALELRIVEERPYSDVANSLGVSEQVARARVSRGLRALARAVDDGERSQGETA